MTGVEGVAKRVTVTSMLHSVNEFCRVHEPELVERRSSRFDDVNMVEDTQLTCEAHHEVKAYRRHRVRQAKVVAQECVAPVHLRAWAHPATLQRQVS